MLDCCTATVKKGVINEEHCGMNNAIMFANSMPSSGTLFAIPGLEFQQSIHAVKPAKSKVVNYNVQQPKKTPIGREI